MAVRTRKVILHKGLCCKHSLALSMKHSRHSMTAGIAKIHPGLFRNDICIGLCMQAAR